MEDWLETWRHKATFNLGESGHAPICTRELLKRCGLSNEEAADLLLDLPLYDSPNWGRADLREHIAALHPGAQLQNVLVTTGTSEALFLLLRALSPKKVALLMPAFQLLYELPKALGAEILGLPVRWSDKGVPQKNMALWEELLRQHRPDVLIFNHPHNPSGLTFSENEIHRIVELCGELGIFLIGDEHYRFLASSENFLGPTLYREKARVAVTGSYIKCLGTPGLRIGWCVGPNDILAKMQNEKNYTTHTVNPFSEAISERVLGAFWKDAFQKNPFRQAYDIWLENKRLLKTFVENESSLQKKGFLAHPPDGGLVTLLGNPNWRDADTFRMIEDALLSAGVFALPLRSMEFAEVFQDMGEESLNAWELGHGFRIGLGALPENFHKALLKIAVQLQKFSNSKLV
jgi:aspartate/methionine/tyrosine aminotransferase